MSDTSCFVQQPNCKDVWCSFSGISTKRIKMKDVKQRPHYDHWLPESEIVHLGFIAFIPNGMQPQHVLSCLSQSIDVYGRNVSIHFLMLLSVHCAVTTLFLLSFLSISETSLHHWM